MKTRYQIYMDFRAAEEIVSHLRNIAQRMSGIADDDMASTLNQIGSSWTGENSKAFLAVGTKLQGKISLNAENVKRIADSVQRIAETTRDAELKAIEIAETSSRGSTGSIAGSGYSGGGSGGGGGESWGGGSGGGGSW